MSDKKAIGGLVKLVAKLGLDYLKPRILTILKPETLTHKLAETVFKPLYASIDALSDNIEDNSAQLGEIWVNYLHDDVRPILVGALDPVIEDIENEYDQAIVVYLRDAGNSLFGIFTDDVKSNREQVKVFFKELALSDSTRTVFIGKLIDLADGAVKDKSLLELFKTVLNAVFDLIQDKEIDASTARVLSGESK
jgi:hypothetical protein